MRTAVSQIGLIIRITSFLFISWILVHLLAVLGVFLAVAYPFWWMFSPNQTVCFFCRARRDGTICPVCGKPVHKKQGISPSSFTSAILNGALIMIITFVSVGVVFGESQALNFFGFSFAQKTVSFIIPTKNQYRLGEIFPMKIEIAGIKQPINTIQADIGFEASRLEVVDISTDDSFANIFIQKEISNDSGYARLTGGVANPGFTADHGIFGTIYFKSKVPGVTKISYLPSSMVLANDGHGTNVLKDYASVSYLILPEKAAPEDEKEQKTTVMKTTVLGTSTGSAQLKFFEDNPVLGLSTQKTIEKDKQINPINQGVNILGTLDNFIVSFWSKIFSVIKTNRS